MSFKEMVEADNRSVFLNANEFAEQHTIVYDGRTYSDIPVLLTKIRESERPVHVGADRVDGIYLASAIAHIALSDMNGIVPEQDQDIQIDDGIALGHPFYRKYRVVTSDCEMGMICLELEAYDE